MAMKCWKYPGSQMVWGLLTLSYILLRKINSLSLWFNDQHKDGEELSKWKVGKCLGMTKNCLVQKTGKYESKERSWETKMSPMSAQAYLKNIEIRKGRSNVIVDKYEKKEVRNRGTNRFPCWHIWTRQERNGALSRRR